MHASQPFSPFVPVRLHPSPEVDDAPQLAFSADGLPDLAGFHMVAAISQDTLNFQFKKLWQSGVIRRELHVDVPDLGVRLDAELDAPRVKLAIADDRRSALFILSLARGTLRYWEGFGPRAEQRSLEFTGWRYAFRVRLDLQEVARSAIESGKAVPEDVRARLAAFRDDMFTIRRLFMDLQSADLADFDARESSTPLPDGSPAGAAQLTRLKDALAIHFKGLAGTASPYILGYSVERRLAVADVPALFAPTGATFSTFRDSPEGRSALNFLLMLGDAPLPGGPLAGLTQSNWIAGPEHDGALVIARDRFHERYIDGLLLPGIAAAVRPYGDSSGFVAVTSKADLRARLGLDDEGLQRHFGGIDDAPGWAINIYRDNLSEQDSDGNRGYGEIVGRDSKMINIYREERRATSFFVRQMPGPDLVFRGRGKAWRTWHYYEYPLGIRTWLAGVDVQLEFGFDARVVAGTDGRLSLAVEWTDNKPTVWHDLSVIAKATDLIANLFSAGLGPQIEATRGVCESIQRNLVETIESELARCFESLAIPVILPAGDVFYFKNARVDDAGAVRFDIAYKREH